MKAVIESGRAVGRMDAPPSKSMAHRLLIAAALSEGQSRVSGLALSQDVAATVDCLRALGAEITIAGDTATVSGIDGGEKSAVLHCRESGSTLRFMLPICLALGGRFTLCGSRRLFERSLGVYEDICRAQDIRFLQGVDSVTVEGRLRADRFCVRGDVSSQFISGLLFAATLMEGQSVIHLTTALESRPYVALTISALADFGVNVADDGDYTVSGGRPTATDCRVEGDYSNAAFFEALTALGGDVTVDNLLPDSLQGDKVYRRHFDAICRGGAEIDLTDCPDLGPILFALAAAKGGARFTGTRRLRIKESDRVAVMAEELCKFGITVTADENSAVIGGELSAPSGVLCGHNDHRIVMALATLCTLTGGQIEGAEAVSKSLPDYFERLQKLGIKVDCYEA